MAAGEHRRRGRLVPGPLELVGAPALDAILLCFLGLSSTADISSISFGPLYTVFVVFNVLDVPIMRGLR